MPVFQTAGNSGGKGIQGKMTSFWYKVWDNCKRVEWKCFSNSFIKSFTHSLKKLSCFVPRIMLSAAYLIPGESGRDRHVHCDCRESEKALGESRRGKFLKVLGLWDYRSTSTGYARPAVLGIDRSSAGWLASSLPIWNPFPLHRLQNSAHKARLRSNNLFLLTAFLRYLWHIKPVICLMCTTWCFDIEIIPFFILK